MGCGKRQIAMRTGAVGLARPQEEESNRKPKTVPFIFRKVLALWSMTSV
jgi:hypothetical protein